MVLTETFLEALGITKKEGYSVHVPKSDIFIGFLSFSKMVLFYFCISKSIIDTVFLKQTYTHKLSLKSGLANPKG